MFKGAGMLFFYTLTPLHPGSGASVTAVDLPIQRERHTNYPMIQASGVKGALRDLADQLRKANQLGNDKEAEQKIEIVFGPKTEAASEHGGALSLTDARILLFPVRSAKGVFTWITCPGVIARLKRDLKIVKATNGNADDQALQEIDLPALDPKARHASTPQDSGIVLENDQIILEDFCFVLPQDAKRDQVGRLAKWLAENAFPSGLNYWRDKLKKDLVLLGDDDFRDFVEMSTEVITRVKLGEKGTVETGPWDEEHLPSETLLYSLALATDPKFKEEDLKDKPIKDAQDVLNFLKNELASKAVMQFGGDETVGKGLVWVRYFEAGEKLADREPSRKAEAMAAGGEEHAN